MSENNTGRLAVLLLGLVAVGGGGAWLGARLLAPTDPVAPPVEASAVAAPQPAPVTPSQEAVAVAPQPAAPVVEDTAEVAPEPEPDPVVEAAPAILYPTFDLVRVEADGTTLVAGAAGAGDLIVLLLDGAEVGRAEAGSDGKFVSFLDLGPSLDVRVLQLQALRDSGPQMSQEEVILAPTPVVAAAPEPEPEVASEPEVATAPTPEGTVEPLAKAETPDTQALAALTPQPGSTPTPAPEAAATPVPVSETVTEVAEPLVTEVSEPVADPTEPPQDTPAEAPAPQVVTQAPVAQGVETGQSAALPTPGPAAPVARAEATQSLAQAATPGAGAAPDKVIAPVPVAPPTEVVVRAPGTPNAPGTDAAAPSVPAAAPQAATTPAPAGPSAAPTVLISRPSGIEVLQGPQVTVDAPAAPRGLALETITYDVAGEVSVAGRGEGAASVRIYLDNQPVLTSPVGADGQWRVDLPEVDTGVYTLRVDQLAEDGTVTARVESPFLREDPTLLAQVQASATAPLQVITVQPGNTLWGIARDRYGEGMAFVRVFDANRDRIRDPDLIYPGQIFDLPE